MAHIDAVMAHQPSETVPDSIPAHPIKKKPGRPKSTKKTTDPGTTPEELRLGDATQAQPEFMILIHVLREDIKVCSDGRRGNKRL